MNNTSKFIENINKSAAKPIVFIDAFNGKRVRPCDDNDISLGEGCLFVAIVSAIWWITYLVLGG